MKLPWVSRRAFTELEEQYVRLLVKTGKAETRETDADFWREAYEGLLIRYDALLEKYHALRVAGANPPEPVTPVIAIPEPDIPPNAVMAAIKQISPTRDATYEANWKFWEQNKERAAEHPEAFADEILEGAVFEPREVSVMWPDAKAVE